jgi:hypothetical protein
MSGHEDEPLTLARIYSLPRAFDTLEEHERFEHRDLPRRARADLARERERVRLRLLLDDDPDVWLLQRMKKLSEVLDRAR